MGPRRRYSSIRNRLHGSKTGTQTPQAVSEVPSENRSRPTQKVEEGPGQEESGLTVDENPIKAVGSFGPLLCFFLKFRIMIFLLPPTPTSAGRLCGEPIDFLTHFD